MKRLSYWLVPLAGWLAPAAVLAQERFYEWHWKMHPMWWGWGLAMMAMMFLFWALVIIGLIVGIRWLLGKGREERSDASLANTAGALRARRDQQGRVRGQKKRSGSMSSARSHNLRNNFNELRHG